MPPKKSQKKETVTKPKQEKEDGEEEEEPEGKEPKEEENNSKSQLSSGRKRNHPTNTPASQPFPKAPKTFESVPDTRKIISFLLSDQALKLLHNA